MQSMVIGVGNAYRRDDGAGVRVARAVGAAQLPGVSAIERGCRSGIRSSRSG